MSDEKSRERRMKHKVVNLILVYFNINNAFYKNEHITYNCELAYKYVAIILVSYENYFDVI